MTEYKHADCPGDGPSPSPVHNLQPATFNLEPDTSPPPALDPQSSATGPINPSIRQSNNPPGALPVPQSSTLNPQPFFPRSPGETPRAYNAFIAFFQLGQARSHQSVADTLGENLGTIKNWSSRFDWSGRLQAIYSGLLQQRLQAQVETHVRHAVDWALRLDCFREQEWDAAQKLLLAAQCYLESFGEDDLRKMTLAQVSRALRISSDIGRLALAGASLPESSDAALSPAQHQLLDAINRVYGVGRAVPSAPHLAECAAAQAADSRGLAGEGSSSSPSTTPSQPSSLNLP